ncbi:MAG: beta-propeller fold lactonase family protein, partial [Pseudomonadota bacterium]
MPGTTVTNVAPFTVTPSVGAAYGLVYGTYIAQYVFGSDGILQPMAATSVQTPAIVQGLTFSPSGKTAYVTVNYSGGASSNRLLQYDVDAHGALSFRAATAGNFSPYSIVVDNAGKYLYAADCCNSDVIAQYSIGVDGSLSSSGNADVATTNVPTAIVMNSAGSYVYVTESQRGEMWQYAVGSGGKLTRVNSGIVGTGSNPIDFVIHPSGKFAYSINNNNGVAFQHGSISQYAIGTGGVLTPLSMPLLATEYLPRQMVIEPSGKYAYVINDNSGNIFEYNIGNDGSLSQFGEIVINSYSPDSVRGLAIDPVGGFLYA